MSQGLIGASLVFFSFSFFFGGSLASAATFFAGGFSWNREVFLKLPPAPFFFSFGYRIPFLAWIGSFPEPETDRDVVPDNTSGLSYEFFGGSFWSDRFAIWTNFRYNEPPFHFFVGPRFVFFCCDDDPDGYKKTFIVFI